MFYYGAINKVIQENSATQRRYFNMVQLIYLNKIIQVDVEQIKVQFESNNNVISNNNFE